jgi:hypothetical protein
MAFVITEQLLSSFQARYPRLRRMDILHAVVEAGPDATRVADHLQQLSETVERVRSGLPGTREAGICPAN